MEDLSLTLLINPIFNKKQLEIVAIYRFQQPLQLQRTSIPILSQFSKLHQIYVNSAQLPLSQIHKTNIHSSQVKNSVFELQNEEFTKNSMRAKFGDYQIYLKHPILLESLSFAFTVSSSSDLIFNNNFARRTEGDISNIIPIPSFLTEDKIKIYAKSKNEKYNIIYTQTPTLLNELFFAIGDVAGVHFKQLNIFLSTNQKLFYPVDYQQLIQNFMQSLNIKKEINIFVDSNCHSVEIFKNFAVIPLVDTENMNDRKTLRFYQICAEAVSRLVFNLHVTSLVNKRACLILQELAKIKLDKIYLSQAEISWDFVQTQTSFCVFCNASMPQLWSSNLFDQKEVTGDTVDQMLKLGFRQRCKQIQNVKWGSLNPNPSNGIPKVFLRDEQFQLDVQTDIDRLKVQTDFVEDQSEISTETVTVSQKLQAQLLQEDWNAEDYLFQDFSYPYHDEPSILILLRLRAKIIALTIFNNTDDTDSILSEYYQNDEFSLQLFLQTLDELQNSQLCSTQAVGAGPDVAQDQYHLFQTVQTTKTHVQQKTQQLTHIIGQLGYCLQAPRVIIQEITDQSGGNKKSQFKLNMINNSPSNMFSDFIQQKLQVFDGIQIIDKKIDRFEKCQVSTAKITNIDDQIRVLNPNEICAINNNHSVLPCLDPKMALPFMAWSRWMQSDSMQFPSIINILDSEIKPDTDAQVPYISIIHRAFTLSKYYYESLLQRLFDIIHSTDFRIRETAIIGVYRFYTTYSNFKHQETGIQNAIKQMFGKLEKVEEDVKFALGCLFDQNYFKENQANEQIVAFTASLLGYVLVKNMDIFYEFIDYDYTVQSCENMISCCALQGIAWQLQQYESGTFTRDNEVYEKAFTTFKNLLGNQNNSYQVHKTVLQLISFLACTLDSEKVILMINILGFEQSSINCDCNMCKFDIDQLINFFIDVSQKKPQLKEVALFCIKGLFMSHVPSYDQNILFMGYIDPEFLLVLARPGEQVLNKCMSSLATMAPSAPLDWLIRDAYRNTHQTVENQFHILFDCQFCYLGGSCTCTRVNRQRDEFQPILESIRYVKESYKESDRKIDASFAPVQEKNCLNCYKRVTSYTTEENINHEPSQQAAPELSPLPPLPYVFGEEWLGSFYTRMCTRSSAGCLVGRVIVKQLLDLLEKGQSRFERLQTLRVISEAVGCGYYQLSDLSEQKILEQSRLAISRTYAAVRAAEEEAQALQASRVPTVRVFEEELHTWVLLQADAAGYGPSLVNYGPMRIK